MGGYRRNAWVVIAEIRIIERVSSGDRIPILTGEDVHRYEIPVPTKWIEKENIKKNVPYRQTKILIRQLGEKINATIDLDGMASTQSVYSILPNVANRDSLYYLLAILNSKLFDFIYRMASGDKQTFKRIILENIKALPIPQNCDEQIKKKLASLARYRFETSNVESSEIEAQIDDLVFQIYNVSPEMETIICQS